MIKANYLIIFCFTTLLISCKKTGCDQKSDVAGNPLSQTEIDAFFYKGNEVISLLHFVNGVLIDTLHLSGSGGFRGDSVRPIKHEELSGCPGAKVLDQTYVLNYSDNLNKVTIKLLSGEVYTNAARRPTLYFKIKNKEFTTAIVFIGNINSLNYQDSITLNGITFYYINKVNNSKNDTTSYLYYGYKSGINYIKIGNEIFQTY
ncbi:MAG: hypothetical protein Q8M15_00200 [Bacteroidota bacterium]|nr:hypothetical protein [Bacteroidota bacterium]